MRVVNPKALVPYTEVPLTDEELVRLRGHVDLRASMRLASGASAKALDDRFDYLRRSNIRYNAEQLWLRTNLPIGSVFDHMGVPIMVIAHNSPVVGPGAAWAASCHCRGEAGGLQALILNVPQLRAILEHKD